MTQRIRAAALIPGGFVLERIVSSDLRTEMIVRRSRSAAALTVAVTHLVCIADISVG